MNLLLRKQIFLYKKLRHILKGGKSEMKMTELLPLEMNPFTLRLLTTCDVNIGAYNYP